MLLGVSPSRQPRETRTLFLRPDPAPGRLSESFAQEALGHNSKAVHRAYAKRALVKIPSLEEYEKRNELLTPKTT